MKRACLFASVIAAIGLVSFSALGDRYAPQPAPSPAEAACTFTTCPVTGKLVMECSETGQKLYAEPEIVKLMVRSPDTGEMTDCSWQGEAVYLEPTTGRIMRKSPETGEIAAWQVRGREVYLCPKTGSIGTKEPTTGQMMALQQQGRPLYFSPKTGRCMPRPQETAPQQP